jgi:RNA polymerase sigma factor (sigma-70 family)
MISEVSDVELVERLGTSKPDRQALGEAYRRFFPVMLGEATRILRGRADAENIVQEGLVRLLTDDSFARLKDGSRVRAFLRTVARYDAINALKAPTGRGDSLDEPSEYGRPWVEAVPSPEETPEERMLTSERKARTVACVREALSWLDERERLIVKDSMADEPTTYLELAARLHCSQRDIRLLEQQALEHLAQVVRHLRKLETGADASPLRDENVSSPEVGTRLENGDLIVGTFTDKHGQTRGLVRERRGVRVKHHRESEAYFFSRAIAPLVAARVKAERKARGWTLLEFAHRLGWRNGNPKERVWAIENATRGHGMLLGTLFHVAETLGVTWTHLLPAADEVHAAIKGTRGRPDLPDKSLARKPIRPVRRPHAHPGRWRLHERVVDYCTAHPNPFGVFDVRAVARAILAHEVAWGTVSVAIRQHSPQSDLAHPPEHPLFIWLPPGKFRLFKSEEPTARQPTTPDASAGPAAAEKRRSSGRTSTPASSPPTTASGTRAGTPLDRSPSAWRR